MDWLNYHHLMYFWLVAREGSVRRASEIMHVTPASVSLQVKQLERSLGTRLFEKEGRRLVLTDMGGQVMTYADQIFTTGQELLEMLKGSPSGRPVELRVGVRDVMPKLVAFQLMRPALELNQHVRIVCHEGTMPELIADLAIHKLDVVLTDSALDPLYKIKAHSHRLGQSEVVIVGAKHQAAKYRRGFPSSLEDAPFLLPTEDCVLRHQLDRWFNDLGLAPAIRGEFADSAMLKIAGRSGLGMFAIPKIIEAEVKKIYGLNRVGIVAGIEESFFAVAAERRVKHPAVIAIRDSALS